MDPPRGLFVTGTDTGVGKTVVSAALMHRYRQPVSDTYQTRVRHVSDTSPVLRYWKPIQTGIEQDDDTLEVRHLGTCRPDEILAEGVRLPGQVSPHLAAQLSGQTIDLGGLLETWAAQPPSRWIVEGAGGVLVPINGRDLMVDLMARLAFPVVVVTRTTLGTINHTLLSIEALRARALQVVGIVMVGDGNVENRKAIETHGRVPVVGELPTLVPLSSDVLANWAAGDLDRDGRLLEFIR